MTTDTPPKARTNAQRVEAWRERNPQRAADVKREYRSRNSKWTTDAKYLSRPFVVWDGEGITLKSGVHIYVMLAVRDGGSDLGDYLYAPQGIGTVQTFEFVLKNAKRFAGGINVIYGGGYDFNMWLRDVPRDDLVKLYKTGALDWQGFRIMWRRGKSFYVAHIGANGKAADGVTIYDCAPFFQVPFVAACDSYLGENFYRRDVVVKNKALRSSFTVADIPDVREYNDIELINLIRLMGELRQRLNKCGLRPQRWDGPGAVAAALLKREHVKNAQTVCPDGPAEAARYAYAGGRFEVLKFGHVKAPAWEYDINSAYPTALRHVPDLTIGEWRYVEGDPGAHPFAIYHVEYKGNDPTIPGPLFRRDPNGTICYPLRLTGWYWAPEMGSTREYCKRGHGTYKVLGAWVYDYPVHDKPFAFIDRLYRMRQVFKKNGDGAHVGIKLGLNSLYGKLAQQVGAKMERGQWRIPPYHQLEWAGYVTSYCRARVLTACMDNLPNVIAFETDAVFVNAELDVPISGNLGDFETVAFDSLTYVQSGMYYGESNGKEVNKTRGIDRGSMTRKDMVRAMSRAKANDRYVNAKLTRFVGIGIALAQSFDRWRRWETVSKRVSAEPSGKRIHLGCACMTGGGRGIALNVWHTTQCPMLASAHSCEFPIAWINPDPNMSELEEMRDNRLDWD